MTRAICAAGLLMAVVACRSRTRRDIGVEAGATASRIDPDASVAPVAASSASTAAVPSARPVGDAGSLRVASGASTLADAGAPVCKILGGPTVQPFVGPAALRIVRREVGEGPE